MLFCSRHHPKRLFFSFLSLYVVSARVRSQFQVRCSCCSCPCVVVVVAVSIGPYGRVPLGCQSLRIVRRNSVVGLLRDVGFWVVKFRKRFRSLWIDRDWIALVVLVALISALRRGTILGHSCLAGGLVEVIVCAEESQVGPRAQSRKRARWWPSKRNEPLSKCVSEQQFWGYFEARPRNRDARRSARGKKIVWPIWQEKWYNVISLRGHRRSSGPWGKATRSSSSFDNKLSRLRSTSRVARNRL